MADGRELRLKIEYNDFFFDATTSIEVWQLDYAGDPVICDAQEDPLVIEWGDKGVQNFPTIYGSTATISFWADAELEMSDLFSTNVFANLVKIYKSAALFWTGFIVPDQYNESRQSAGVGIPLQIVATDMLTYMAGLESSEVKCATQRVSLKDWLTAALALTNVPLELHHAIDWENNLDVAFVDLVIDTRAFEGKKIGEVIEGVFYGCRLLQRGARWALITYTAFLIDVLDMIAPNDDLNEIDAERDDFWFEGHVNMEYFPSVKSQPFKQLNNYRENLLLNGDFDSATDSWTAVLCTITNIDGGYEKKEEKLCKVAGRNAVTGFPQTMTKYMWQSIADIDAGDSCFCIEISYGVIGATGAKDRTELYAMFYLQDSPYTTTLFGSPVADPAGRLWLEFVEGGAGVGIIARIGSALDEEGVPTINDPYSCEQENIGVSMKTWKIFTQSIPMAGTLFCRLYAPYTDNTDIEAAVYDKVVVRMVSATLMERDRQVEGALVLNATRRVTQKEITLLCGDFPSHDNKLNTYFYGLFSAAGGYTSTWNRVGQAATASLNFLRMRNLLQLTSDRRLNYSTQLADIVPSLAQVYVDADNNRTRLLENGISYHDRMNVVEGQFTELLNITVE
jgi:hypothetical protein